MKSINFKTNPLTEYAVNGDPSKVIRINLNDVNLKKRIGEASARMEEIERKYGDTLTAEQAIAADAEIRELFNATFDTDISTPAFGGTNCLTKVDGLPLFAHFFSAFSRMLIEDLKAIASKHRAEQMNPNVERYTAPLITRQQPIAGLTDPFGELNVSQLSEEQKTMLLKQLLT